MPNAMFSPGSFGFNGVQDVYGRLQGPEKGVNKEKQTHLFGTEDFGDVGFPCSEYDLYQEVTTDQGVLQSKDQHQPFPDPSMFGDFNYDLVSSPFQSCQEPTKLDTTLTRIPDSIEPKKDNPYPFPISSLELLSQYNNGVKRLNGDRLSEQRSETTFIGGRELSTEEVMRVAGARYIQLAAERGENPSMFRYPFSSSSISGLTDEETKDVHLAQLLLESAEKISKREFELARELLYQCDYMSSITGNPVQRIVHYFSKALQERIDRETGRFLPKRSEEKGGEPLAYIEDDMMAPNPALLACHQELPFSQVLQFTGMEAIIESVASARRIHLIDLGIRIGMQWTVLIQALATRFTCPLERFTITAVGTTSRHKIEETGKRLESFAETMNIPFSFKIVMVSDMRGLREDLFDLEVDEAVAVYSSVLLRSLISWPDCLEALMSVIRNLNPCIMVVIEIEANHNSPSFVDRFIEALFYYSAFFDCLDSCLDRSNPNRITTEQSYFGPSIWNIVATEGKERTIRHVKSDVWKSFFARFGMVETELSPSSLYQASLVTKQSPSFNSCTLEMNGKCLAVGWKGTPLHTLSAWKFY